MVRILYNGFHLPVVTPGYLKVPSYPDKLQARLSSNVFVVVVAVVVLLLLPSTHPFAYPHLVCRHC